ncbi:MULTISPECIES: matrixin family metalloprotease [unclassified Thioalkalivibrio]|uniref:matrixin family metalloprotease n=1 Tax=unclassified Thioalkalivibrio TaxID=2621013 RepID=UPI00036B756E|nr:MULTISPECIES: matrixin family metalloprotease [unclassified Thioalkalivibrio]
MAGFLPLALPLPALADDGGYRLLKLDGYKVKWGEQQLGVGASISYAFAGEALRFDDAHNCRDLAPIDELLGEALSMETLDREAAAAFRVWERAAGLSFHKVSDTREADIILGAQGQPRGRAFANVAYAPDSDDFSNVSYSPDAEVDVRTIEQSLVCLNPAHEWKVGFDGNKDVYDIRYTLTHEIGHAIGLDHPGPSGQVMGFRYTEDFADLQPGDLRGVQRLYGRPADTLDTQLAEKPTEDGESAFNSDRFLDPNDRIVPVTGVDSGLGIGEK